MFYIYHCSKLDFKDIILFMCTYKLSLHLGASSPLCYKQLGTGWGTSKHNCLVSYLLF